MYVFQSCYGSISLTLVFIGRDGLNIIYPPSHPSKWCTWAHP